MCIMHIVVGFDDAMRYGMYSCWYYIRTYIPVTALHVQFRIKISLDDSLLALDSAQMSVVIYFCLVRSVMCFSL